MSRNLVNHFVFGRTYVQQCHGIRYTSQDFIRSIVSRNSRSTVSQNLVNQSIFGCTYVQQCYGFRDTCQNIVNYSILVHSTGPSKPSLVSPTLLRARNFIASDAKNCKHVKGSATPDYSKPFIVINHCRRRVCICTCVRLQVDETEVNDRAESL